MVIGKEKITVELKKNIKAKNISWEKYWGTKTRSVNVYQDYEAVILVGAAYPREEDLINEAKAFFYDDNEPIISNNLQIVKGLRYYTDFRVQKWLEQSREAEMVQAINRIRPYSSSNKYVYILSKLPLPNIKTIKVTWSELEELIGLINLKDNKSNKDQIFQVIENIIRTMSEEKRSFNTLDIFNRLTQINTIDLSRVKDSTLKRYIHEATENLYERYGYQKEVKDTKLISG